MSEKTAKAVRKRAMQIKPASKADDAEALQRLHAAVSERFRRLQAEQAPSWRNSAALTDTQLCQLLIGSIAQGDLAGIGLYTAMALARDLPPIALPRAAATVATAFLQGAKS